jgi:hypothetical protein
MKDGPFRVRTMRPEEVALAVEWAAERVVRHNNIVYGGWVEGFDTAPTTVPFTEVPFD